MKWIGRRQSDNMEDRRGLSGGKAIVGGGIIGGNYSACKLAIVLKASKIF